MRSPSVVSSQRYTFIRGTAAIMTTAKYQELSSCPPLKKDETTIIIIKTIKKEFRLNGDGYTKRYYSLLNSRFASFWGYLFSFKWF